MSDVTVGIVIYEGVEELDWVGPWEVFTAAAASGGLRTVSISQRVGPIDCAKGMRAQQAQLNRLNGRIKSRTESAATKALRGEIKALRAAVANPACSVAKEALSAQLETKLAELKGTPAVAPTTRRAPLSIVSHPSSRAIA